MFTIMVELAEVHQSHFFAQFRDQRMKLALIGMRFTRRVAGFTDATPSPSERAINVQKPRLLSGGDVLTWNQHLVFLNYKI